PRPTPHRLRGRWRSRRRPPSRRRTRTTRRPSGLRTGDPKKSLAALEWSGDQKREVVMTLADTYPIRLVCRLLGVPRSSVSYTPQPAADEAMLKTALLDLAGEWPTYGYRRLTAMMKRLGWRVNAKRVRRWMDELNLAGAPPVRKTRTTDSGHAFPRYPNLVKDLKIRRPERVWVADITYIRLHDEFVYLAVVMDVFTRSIRGWHLGRDLDQGLTRAALERALVVA